MAPLYEATGSEQFVEVLVRRAEESNQRRKAGGATTAEDADEE
jgi:hypothetical protein